MKKKRTTKTRTKKGKKLALGNLKVTLLTPTELESIYGGTQVNPPIGMMVSP